MNPALLTRGNVPNLPTLKLYKEQKDAILIFILIPQFEKMNITTFTLTLLTREQRETISMHELL